MNIQNSFSHCRRKLVAIPADVEDYTGRLIQNCSVSCAGKTIVFHCSRTLILLHCHLMPNAACQVCKESMPLHILALLVEGCMESESTADDDDDGVNACI